MITYIEEPSIDFIDKKYFDEIHNKYINSYIEEDLIRLFGISPKEFEFSDLKTYEENSFNSYMNFSKAGGSNE